MKLALRLEQSGNRSCSHLTHGVKLLPFAQDLLLRILAALPRTTPITKQRSTSFVLDFCSRLIPNVVCAIPLIRCQTDLLMGAPDNASVFGFHIILQRFGFPIKNSRCWSVSNRCLSSIAVSRILSCKICQAGAFVACFSMILVGPWCGIPWHLSR